MVAWSCYFASNDSDRIYRLRFAMGADVFVGLDRYY
jgi:hypothetical protein